MAVVIAEDRGAADDAAELVTAEYELLDPVVDVHQAMTDASVLHESAGTNVASRYTVSRGSPDAAFAGAEYTRTETFRCHRHGAMPLETRGLVAEWDAVGGADDRVGRHQGDVLQPGHARADARAGPSGRGSRGARRRGQLRRAGRVLPRGLPDPVRRDAGGPPGEVDRGPPRAPHDGEPLARDRVRAHDRRAAGWDDPRPPGPALRRHGRLRPDQRRGRPRQGRAVPAGTVPHRELRLRGERAGDQQDTHRDLPGPGPLRGEFLPRAPHRSHGGGPRARPGGGAAEEPPHAGGDALRDRQARAVRSGGRVRHRGLRLGAPPGVAGHRLPAARRARAGASSAAGDRASASGASWSRAGPAPPRRRASPSGGRGAWSSTPAARRRARASRHGWRKSSRMRSGSPSSGSGCSTAPRASSTRATERITAGPSWSEAAPSRWRRRRWSSRCGHSPPGARASIRPSCSGKTARSIGEAASARAPC